MATAVRPMPAVPLPPNPIWPQPLRWTCEEYSSLHGLRWVEGRKLILVEGEILEMAAPSPLHNSSLGLAEDWLRSVFPSGQYWVRNQMGMTLGINTDPLPDLLVVPGNPRSYTRQAMSGVLLIEVADTSVAYDTGDKASLYAAAGITDYWVIDVENRRLHVFRGPQPDPTRKYGHWYAQVAVLTPADSIAPLAAPTKTVTVAELLP